MAIFLPGKLGSPSPWLLLEKEPLQWTIFDFSSVSALLTDELPTALFVKGPEFYLRSSLLIFSS
jgi:hypothetical protein